MGDGGQNWMGLGIGLKLKQSGRGVCVGGMVQLGPDKCFALLGPGIQKLSRNQCGQMMHFVQVTLQGAELCPWLFL